MNTISILGIKTILLFFYFGNARADYPVNDDEAFYRNVATNLNQNTNINQNTNAGWPEWNPKPYLSKIDPKIWRNEHEGKRYLPEHGRFRDDDDDELGTTGDPKLKSGLIREFIRQSFSLKLKKVLEELLALIDEDMEKPSEDANAGDDDIASELGKIDLSKLSETNFQDTPINTDTPSLLYDEWPDKTDDTQKAGRNAAMKHLLSMKTFSFLRPPRFIDVILKPKIRNARIFIRQMADKFFGPI